MNEKEHSERVSNERQSRRDLSDFAGTWREDPAFDDALAQQDTIDASRVTDILQRVDATPTLDRRSPEEILGYEENGLPH